MKKRRQRKERIRMVVDVELTYSPDALSDREYVVKRMCEMLAENGICGGGPNVPSYSAAVIGTPREERKEER